MICIRGAVAKVENTKEDILDKTVWLLENIIQENKIDLSEIISILFSATSDLDQVYPAVAARQLGITNAALFCVQEMRVVNSMAQCIRIMMTVEKKESQKDVKHIYLGEAVQLRPDIACRDKGELL